MNGHLTSTAPTATRSEALTLTLLAPLSGPLVPLDAVPDEAFRQRMVGDGVAVDPTSDTVLAPNQFLRTTLVPEPTSAALFLLGALALRRRR